MNEIDAKPKSWTKIYLVKCLVHKFWFQWLLKHRNIWLCHLIFQIHSIFLPWKVIVKLNLSMYFSRKTKSPNLAFDSYTYQKENPIYFLKTKEFYFSCNILWFPVVSSNDAIALDIYALRPTFLSWSFHVLYYAFAIMKQILRLGQWSQVAKCMQSLYK